MPENLVRENSTISALILDSCPGQGRKDSAKKAFGANIKLPILKAILGILADVLYWYCTLRGTVLAGVPLRFTRMRNFLNSESALPWLTRSTPRLYAYSNTDPMVPWQEVEAHAAEAEALGFNVQLLKFANSPHVAHARGHPETYWGAVAGLWKKASTLS